MQYGATGTAVPAAMPTTTSANRANPTRFSEGRRGGDEGKLAGSLC